MNVRTFQGERAREITVRTEYERKPGPERLAARFDWSAVTDNYEPGHPIGYGTTERDAIDDLLEQLDDEIAATERAVTHGA
jgi:hypothetical protein